MSKSHAGSAKVTPVRTTRSPVGRRVACFCMLLLWMNAAPPAWAEAPASNSRIAAIVERFFQERAADGFTGAVRIDQGGKTLFKEAYGVVSEATKQPATLDTIYDVGSITKQFTAIAILQLERQGRLTVNDPLNKFFPSVPSDKAHYYPSNADAFFWTP
jgi:CubicO group peptidase (beta-lactamase class C family)